MTALRRILLALAALLAILVLACGWLLNSQGGARFAVKVATRVLDGKLSTGTVAGSIARGLDIADARWRDAAAGIDARAGELRVRLAAGELLTRTLRLNAIALRDVSVSLTSVTRDEPTQDITLEPPLDIVVDAFTLERGELRRDGAATLAIERAALAGEWTDSGIVLDHARVVAPQGTISLEARLGLQAPWLEHASGAFDWQAGGRRWKGSLASVGEARDIVLRGGLDSPFPMKIAGESSHDRSRTWRLAIELPRFDPREDLMPDGRLEALAADLEARGVANEMNVSGNIDLDDQRLSIRELLMVVSTDGISVDSLRVGMADGPGELRGTGRIRLDQPDPAVFAHLQWDGLDLPARWVGDPVTTSGQAFVDGSLEHFDSHGAVDVRRGSLRSSVAWKADGSRSRIHLRHGRVTQAKGLLMLTGELGLAAPVSWRLSAAARGFDPSALAPGWPGALDFEIDTHGELPEEGPRARFELRDLRGRLRNRPITGDGNLTLEPDMRLGGRLELRSGSVSLDVTGTHGNNARADARLEVPSLADWNSQLRGRVQVEAQAIGRWPDTTFHATARGRDMEFADNSFGEASIDFTLRTPRSPSFELNAKARRSTLSDMSFDTIAVTASGTGSAHRLSITADGHPLDASLVLHGAYSRQRWSGRLDVLKLDLEDAPALALEEPVPVELAADAFEFGRTCLSGGDIRLCLAGSGDTRGRFDADYSLSAVPLDLLVRLAQPATDLKIAGHLDGEGRLSRTTAGSITGKATLASASGSLEQSGQDSPLRFEYDALEIDATFEGDTASAHASANFEPDGNIAGTASVANLLAGPATLEGNLTAALRDLAPLEWMLPQLTSVAGSGELAATLGGTLDEPEISARLAIREFRGDVPALGIQLGHGELVAQMDDDGSIDTRAKVSSGEGVLEIGGRSASIRELDLTISGERFLAANFPAAHLIVSPELTLTGRPDNLALGGTITIPQASIDLDKMTNQGGAQISPDVVVIDRPERQARNRLAMHSDVRVVLGRDVKLTGFGLDATVAGQLRVIERPGAPSTGSGEIRLDGTYEAFGRTLAIERGQMLFANSPLDNPQLDVLATRRMPDITAKLRVTGSARRPQLDAFTDPATSPTEAMSYLLTGKSMSDLRGTEGERVESAAQSLGGVLGDRLARGIGAKFGIDSVGVEQSDELGTSAFTVGKYLSPGFFVSYGVGLFQPGTVITLRYAISERWSLEAVDSPNEQRGGINFRIER